MVRIENEEVSVRIYRYLTSFFIYIYTVFLFGNPSPR